MVAVARAHGVRALLATWAYTPEFNDYVVLPHYIRGYREGNDVVRKVAQSMGTYYFDFASLMPDDKKFWVDGMHVNEDGALMKAQLFAKYIHEAGLIPPRGD